MFWIRTILFPRKKIIFPLQNNDCKKNICSFFSSPFDFLQLIIDHANAPAPCSGWRQVWGRFVGTFGLSSLTSCANAKYRPLSRESTASIKKQSALQRQLAQQKPPIAYYFENKIVKSKEPPTGYRFNFKYGLLLEYVGDIGQTSQRESETFSEIPFSIVTTKKSTKHKEGEYKELRQYMQLSDGSYVVMPIESEGKYNYFLFYIRMDK